MRKYYCIVVNLLFLYTPCRLDNHQYHMHQSFVRKSHISTSSDSQNSFVIIAPSHINPLYTNICPSVQSNLYPCRHFISPLLLCFGQIISLCGCYIGDDQSCPFLLVLPILLPQCLSIQHQLCTHMLTKACVSPASAPTCFTASVWRLVQYFQQPQPSVTTTCLAMKSNVVTYNVLLLIAYVLLRTWFVCILTAVNPEHIHDHYIAFLPGGVISTKADLQ